MPTISSSRFSWLAPALLLLLALCCRPAHADNCSVSMSNITFAAVSPVSGSDYYANGSGTITCYWSALASLPPYALLAPQATVCLNLNLGSNSTGTNPRTLGNGGLRMNYNLYGSNSYADSSIWGDPAASATPTPMSFYLQAPSLLSPGTATQNFTVYGKVPAGTALATMAQTVGNADTDYTSTFTATVKYAYYLLIAPSCQSGLSSSFTFNVKATVKNDCNINVGSSMSFPTSAVLNAAVYSTSSLTVQCTLNNSYQIALNGGSISGNVAARQMKNLSTTERVNYVISSVLDGPSWGDGSAGSALVSGIGDGVAHVQTVYGKVPAQATPSPGDYKDTVTATVYF